MSEIISFFLPYLDMDTVVIILVLYNLRRTSNLVSEVKSLRVSMTKHMFRHIRDEHLQPVVVRSNKDKEEEVICLRKRKNK